jgi:hypothetical protein
MGHTFGHNCLKRCIGFCLDYFSKIGVYKEDLVRQQSEIGSKIGIRISIKNPQANTEKNTCNK